MLRDYLCWFEIAPAMLVATAKRRINDAISIRIPVPPGGDGCSAGFLGEV